MRSDAIPNGIKIILAGALISIGTLSFAQDQDSEPKGAYYTLNDVVTVLPTQIFVPEGVGGGVSTQIISRQNIDGGVGFVWNITLRYQFLIPDADEISNAVGGKKFSLPKTIEYQTYLTHRANEATVTTQPIDGGTANTQGVFASSIDIEFEDANSLTEFVASGAEVGILSAIRFPQVTSVAPDTEDVQQVILDYLSTNLISPNAPVLSTYAELLEQHPEVVGRNPAVTLSALASIFEQSSIVVDDQGNPRLEMPPVFNINFNATLATPRNIRFTDRSIARGTIQLCEEAEVVLLEVGLTGCEKIEQLIERFE